MINSIEDIQNLVLAGLTDWSKYGLVNVKEQEGLLIFNYSQERQFTPGKWNYFESISRGLIINAETAEIVARPFPKFFNYGQNGVLPNSPMVSITEKLDGSLGILFRDNGQYRIATRGSLNSDQAIWATKFLNDNYDLTNLPEEYTLLFEIIYPENRIVIDYGDREDLALLAVINRFTGEELPFYDTWLGTTDTVYLTAQWYGFSLPEVYSFNNPSEILEWCRKIRGTEDEGCVVLYADGLRLKFKGDEYVELHRLISNITFKHVFEAYTSGTIQTFLEAIPDEFYANVNVWISAIDVEVSELDSYARNMYEKLPKKTRKEFALAINDKKDLPLLFALYDSQKDRYMEMLYKKVYEKLKLSF